MGYSKNGTKRDIHKNQCLHQKIEIFHLKNLVRGPEVYFSGRVLN
jgi:hypothetical protein